MGTLEWECFYILSESSPEALDLVLVCVFLNLLVWLISVEFCLLCAELAVPHILQNGHTWHKISFERKKGT